MWGYGNVSGMIIMKKEHKENREICPSGAYTGWGPQGSINTCVACIGQNTPPNQEILEYMHIYAFV